MQSAAKAPPYLTIQLPGGEPQTHEVTGPPGVIRFAVGSHARRSSIWRVWSDSKRSDVYVGVRNFAGFQKFSLHESGQWHHAFVDADAAQGQGFPSRYMDTWEKPENGPSGWTKALAVKVHSGSLSEPDDDNVMWLPDAPGGCLAIIGDRHWRDRGQAELPVAAYRLANGNTVVVMHETERSLPITAAPSRMPLTRSRLARRAKSGHGCSRPKPTPRAWGLRKRRRRCKSHLGPAHRQSARVKVRALAG